MVDALWKVVAIGTKWSYQAILERDYNLIMGSIFIQSILMLFGNLISDLAYMVVDPRIDFS